MKISLFTTVVLTLCSHVAALTYQQANEENLKENLKVNSKCSKSEYDIQNSADLAQLSGCSIISGNLHISSFDANLLDLGQIKEVKGDLTITNVSDIQKIQGLNLKSISGTLGFDTLTSLTSLLFPKLESIDTLRWHVLPILTTVDLGADIKNIKSIILSDTSLTGFSGFNVDTLRNLYISNNRFLEKIESSVTKITGQLSIAANADNLELSLPDLTWVKSITIRDATKVDLHSLQTIDQNADFIQNNFDALELPQLVSTGQTLSVINNDKLEKLDFGSLNDIGGGLMVIDNEKVNKVECFPNLKTVGGAVELQGNISKTSFNEIRIVKGSALLKSTSNELDCKSWMIGRISKAVRGGKLECSSANNQKSSKSINENGQISNGSNDHSGDDSFFKQKESASWSLRVSLLSVLAGASLAIFWNMM